MVEQRGVVMRVDEVQAILENRKTQFRKVIKGIVEGPGGWPSFAKGRHHGNMVKPKHCPYGQPGDLLWVKQPWAAFDLDWRVMDDWQNASRFENQHIAIDIPSGFKWWPSVTMPKRACRLWLRVTNVRVERVQEILARDVLKEGLQFYQPDGDDKETRAFGDVFDPNELPVGWCLSSWGGWSNDNYGAFIENEEELARYGFERLWDSINAKNGYGWDVNPWLFATTFERCEAPK